MWDFFDREKVDKRMRENIEAFKKGRKILDEEERLNTTPWLLKYSFVWVIPLVYVAMHFIFKYW